MISCQKNFAISVQAKILILRKQRIILDRDLAELYGVPVKRLNEQVKRNRARFPYDFMFQLSSEECDFLRSHFATSNTGRGGRRYRPYAFSEDGAIMMATVLNSDRAIRMSLLVVRAFVRLREMMGINQQLAIKIGELESRIEIHDDEIRELIDAIRRLMAPPRRTRGRIGFELPVKSSVSGRSRAAISRAG